MPLVKNIEQKIKINKAVSIAVIIASVLLVIATLVFAYKLISDSRKSIYVLDNGIPILISQTDELKNRPVEYRSQIELYHRLFFTLPPDDEYIKDNIKKALYLIDDSGKKEYTNLKEKGFFNQLISSNSMVSVHLDSLKVDEQKKRFIYFGTQTINRKSAIVKRKLVTQGQFKDITRSPNNPHGVMLLNWSILDNSEISNEPKISF